MQPLNAARLFSAALAHQGRAARRGPRPGAAPRLVAAFRRGPDHRPAGHLRLESGRVSAERNPFPLNNLYDALGVEFKTLAQEQGLHFPPARRSQLRVDSDIKLLRRILQNFLTNAFRYAKGPRAARRPPRDGYLRLEVWDQAGHPTGQTKVIFEEFKRLDSHQTRAEKRPRSRPGDRRPALQGPRPSAGSTFLAGQGQRLQRPRTAGAGRRRRPWPTATRPNRRRR